MKRMALHIGCTGVLALVWSGVFGLPSSANASPVNAESCSLTATNGTETRVLGGRTYQLRVPAGITESQVPLLVDLHGGGGHGLYYDYLTGWSGYADAKKNFIIAYPNSLTPWFWNYTEGSYDVPFLRSVVDDIAATYCLDPKRVFVDGHSNGGLMADRVACEAADKFAAFAPYAGSSSQGSIQPTGFGECHPSRQVPIAFFHGDNDTQAPIQYQKTNRDWWLDFNNCDPTPVRTTDTYGFLDTYAPCDGGAEIWWRELKDQTHAWPSGAEGEDQRDRMWAFFNAHPLP